MSYGRILVDFPMIEDAVRAHTDALNEERFALYGLISQVNDSGRFGINAVMARFLERNITTVNQIKQDMEKSCREIMAAMDSLQEAIYMIDHEELVYPLTDPLPKGINFF